MYMFCISSLRRISSTLDLMISSSGTYISSYQKSPATPLVCETIERRSIALQTAMISPFVDRLRIPSDEWMEHRLRKVLFATDHAIYTRSLHSIGHNKCPFNVMYCTDCTAIILFKYLFKKHPILHQNTQWVWLCHRAHTSIVCTCMNAFGSPRLVYSILCRQTALCYVSIIWARFDFFCWWSIHTVHTVCIPTSNFSSTRQLLIIIIGHIAPLLQHTSIRDNGIQ